MDLQSETAGAEALPSLLCLWWGGFSSPRSSLAAAGPSAAREWAVSSCSVSSRQNPVCGHRDHSTV